ncbi:unnamed protein product [Echinostoma caproni]|uniref:Uncharacterized protein n=1 Tax=Echinostoma caproni TaxID=27848 RepID=A0A183B900_9TREM|nr:unnamed protein product [Echinostoma caproni]
MLCGRHRQLPGNLLKRLQKCAEWEPPEPYNRLLLLLSLPDPAGSGTETKQSSGSNDPGDRALFQTSTPSMPGLSAPALLACQANTLMGCSPLMNSTREPPEEGIPVCGVVQCAGHALASSTPYASDGVGTGVGVGAGALGTDLLTSRLIQPHPQATLRVPGDSASEARGVAGVGITLSDKAERSLLDCIPVSSRLCAVRLDVSVRINSYRTVVYNTPCLLHIAVFITFPFYTF